MNEDLLKLPFEIQVALGSGYAAYMIAYTGIRDHHKSVDTVFRAICFGLIAALVLTFAPAEWIRGWVRPALAILLTLVAGVLWRSKGIDLYLGAIRSLTWSDDIPSAWSAITTHNSRRPVSQISVQLADGSWLNCDEVGNFNDAPFGPVVLGTTGDIAMYVTSEEDVAGNVTQNGQVRDVEWGDRMTFIPASEIRRVALRFVPKPL